VVLQPPPPPLVVEKTKAALLLAVFESGVAAVAVAVKVAPLANPAGTLKPL
jgi:hypothetical protein